MKEQIRIGIAEDHDLLRQGLVSLLNNYETISVVFDVSNGHELLQQLKSSRPQVILLDLEMPVMSGREVLEKIRQKYPAIKIIVLSAFFQESQVITYVKKGISAYLPKDCKISKVVEAIQAVHQHGTYFDGKVSSLLAKEVAGPAPGESKPAEQNVEFSERELSIIRLICTHKTSEEIADDLSLSKRTIDWYRDKIMRKIGSRNVTALITYAIQRRIVNLPGE